MATHAGAVEKCRWNLVLVWRFYCGDALKDEGKVQMECRPGKKSFPVVPGAVLVTLEQKEKNISRGAKGEREMHSHARFDYTPGFGRWSHTPPANARGRRIGHLMFFPYKRGFSIGS